MTDNEMRDTVIFSFEATSATLHTSFSKETTSTPFIIYQLKHQLWQTVLTPEGVDLTGLKWSIQVYAMENYNDHMDKAGGIGYVRSPDSGRFHISAAIGVSAFDRLARSNFLPEKVIVHARGLTYGNDSSLVKNIVWSNEEDAIVTEVAFSVPLAAPLETDISEASVTTKLGFELARRAITILYVIAIASALIGLKLYLHWAK